jgi:two-component system CheB/CheR fusion protein
VRRDDFQPRSPPLDAHTARDWLWAFATQTTEQAILLLDPGGVILWSNAGAAKILAAASPAGQLVHEYFLAEDVAAGIPAFELAVAGSRGWMQDDRWMQRADGSRFWASGMTNALHDGHGVLFGYLKLMRNLTHAKMQMEGLRQRAAAGMSAVATVAHELRNPLSALAMAGSVIEHGGYDDQRFQAAVAILQNNVRLATRLVEDLQDASRASTGKLRLDVEPVLLADVLRASIAVACGRDQGARKVELFLADADVVVRGDALRLQQVFVNLVGNALRYTPGDGRIWVNASVEGPQAQVEVADTGMGIAPHMLESIFEMFTQVDGNADTGGMGIGLALVKQIVELHEGSVQAQSDGIGKGSKFIVRLPLLRR